MTSCTLITAPASEPITLTEAKTQARVDTSADDTLITSLIGAARQWAENYTRRAFITQTWRLSMDDAPKQPFIVLPHPPLIAVTSVKSFDDTDASTVWSSANYFVDNARAPGRLALRSGATWPSPSRLTNGITIDYTAGYGADASAVPQVIKLAIGQLVAHWYEHRGEAAMDTSIRRGVTIVPLVIQALLDPYRVQGVA